MQSRVNFKRTIRLVAKRDHEFVAHLSYTTVGKARMTRLAEVLASAWFLIEKLNPFFLGASENPNAGRLGATTWKLGSPGLTAVSKGMSLAASMKCHGPETASLNAFEIIKL